MRPRIILEVSVLGILLMTTSINGLFFHYPKNVLTDFFQSFHHKKEPKQPPSDIHHFHLHYYPTYSYEVEKPVKAPVKFDLDKLHSNHLESLGWSDHEYKHVPEPVIYIASPQDSWPEASNTRPSIWDVELPKKPQPMLEQREIPKSGVIVQVPIQQKIIVQQPPAEETSTKNPLVSFIQGILRIKNSIFQPRAKDKITNPWYDSPDGKVRDYFVYGGFHR